jgi:hypothetical protein
MTANKLIWAVLGAIALGLQGAVTDGGITLGEWITVAAAGLAAFGTWLVPNTPALATAKTWVNAVVLGAGVIVPLLVGGLSQQEVWTVVIAVLTAAGVYAVPNRTPAYGQHSGGEYGGGPTPAGNPNL